MGSAFSSQFQSNPPFKFTMLSRSITARATAQRMVVRCLTGSPLPVDVDNYVSGWNIDDIAEFTKDGFYNVQTYNKISEQVSFIAC